MSVFPWMEVDCKSIMYMVNMNFVKLLAVLPINTYRLEFSGMRVIPALVTCGWFVDCHIDTSGSMTLFWKFDISFFIVGFYYFDIVRNADYSVVCAAFQCF